MMNFLWKNKNKTKQIIKKLTFCYLFDVYMDNIDIVATREYYVVNNI